MSFAKSILQKYGWKEGEGLGRNSDGITAPIKASLKFSTAGIGADQAKDLTDHWWERVFNDASNNLEVVSGGNSSQGDGGVSVRQRDANAVEITTKSYSVSKLRQQTGGTAGGTKYGTTFLKASTLLAGVGREQETPNSVNMQDVEFKESKVLTDEELFAACGGRTAHKGARHGLNLNGKLSRIDEQDNKLLQKLENETYEAVIKSNDWQVQHAKHNRKRTKKQKRNEQRWLEKSSEDMVDNEMKDMVHNAEYVVAKNRKKKKLHQERDQDLANAVASMFSVLPVEDGLGEVVEPSPKAETKKKTKCKKKSKGIASKKQLLLEDELEELTKKISKLNHNSVTIKKKCKKNKKKLKKAAAAGDDVDDEDDALMQDPGAKYRKGYRPDLKKINRLLKSVVPHEVPEEKAPPKPTRLLRSDSSDASDQEEDVVQRVNAEQKQYWKKMRAAVPKIKIIEPAEDDCLPLGQAFQERHKNEVKRLGKHVCKKHLKKKKSKKKSRQVSQLADSLSKKL